MIPHGRSAIASVAFSKNPNDPSSVVIETFESQDAKALMTLDGIEMNGHSLKITHSQSSLPPPSPHRIYVAGIPYSFPEDQLRDILSRFGTIMELHVIKDSTGGNRGFAFLDYTDASIVDTAIAEINNIRVQDRTLFAQRASAGKMAPPSFNPVPPHPSNVAHHQSGPSARDNPIASILTLTTDLMGVFSELGHNFDPKHASKNVQLLNMASEEQLASDSEFEILKEEVIGECSKFGTIVDLHIPRPRERRFIPGLFRVFVQFETVEAATACQRQLFGRKYNRRCVLTTFISDKDLKRQKEMFTQAWEDQSNIPPDRNDGPPSGRRR